MRARPGTALLAEGVAPGRIVLGGDSAGGGLAFALLHELLAEGRPGPAAVVAFSPWTDLTGTSASLRSLARRDALIPVRRFAEIRDLYLDGADPRDPRASPAFGRYRGRAAGADPVEPRRGAARRRPADGGAAARGRRRGDPRGGARRARTSGSSTRASCRRPTARSTARRRSCAALRRRRGRCGVSQTTDVWVALLYSVVLGPGRRVEMAPLRAMAEDLGLGEVRTLVATGNLVFTGAGPAPDLERRLEAAFAARFGKGVGIFVRGGPAWRRLVAGNPFLAAADAAPASVHVRVMRAPIAPEAVARLEAVRAGAERLAVVDGDLWLHLPGGFGTSRLATAAGAARIGSGHVSELEHGAAVGRYARGVTRSGEDAMAGRIRIGVGGWTFEPWRGAFFPDGLPQKRELEYMAGKLSSIEINGTFYRTPEAGDLREMARRDAGGLRLRAEGAALHDEPQRAGRSGRERRALRRRAGSPSSATSSGRSTGSWRRPRSSTATTWRRSSTCCRRRSGDRPLRHALEVRHASFADDAFLELARERGVAVVLAGDSDYPVIEGGADDFVYARIMGTTPDHAAGYADEALDAWAARARGWADAGRDVYLYVISGHKAANPAAAMALIERVGLRRTCGAIRGARLTGEGKTRWSIASSAVRA